MFKWPKNKKGVNRQPDTSGPNYQSAEQSDYERPAVLLERPLSEVGAAEAAYRKHDREYKDRQSWFNFLLVAFTGVTAVIGIWQGCLTKSAIDSNNRQAAASEDSNRIARASITSNLTQNREILQSSAAQNAAVLTEAAKENREALGAMQTQQVLAFKQGQNALDLSKRNFAADQRAWVGALNVAVVSFQDGEKGRFSVVFTNFGKTVAKNVRMTTYEKAFAWGEIFLGTSQSSIKDRMSLAVIYPNQPIAMILETAGVISSDEIRGIESGAKSTHFWGNVFYEDVSGFRHETDFCGMIVKTTKTLSFCDTYNEAN